MANDGYKVPVRLLPFEDLDSPPSIPERALMAQVLYRAVCDLFEYDSLTRAQARAWLLSQEDNADTHITFCFICNVLDIDRMWFLMELQKAIEESKGENGLVRKGTLRRFMTRTRRLRLFGD